MIMDLPMRAKPYAYRWLAGLILAVSVLAASVPAAGGPGELKVVASGVGHILKDPREARSSALREALRAALEHAVGRLVLAKTLGRFYPLVAEELLLNPDSYISGYGVVSESETEGLIRVTVSTIIPLAPLREALEKVGVFTPEARRPRVLVAVAERNDEEAAFVKWWSSPAGSSKFQSLPFNERLAAMLAGRGLVVIPLRLDRKSRFEGDDPIEIARALGATAAVTGEVTLGIREGSSHAGTANLKVVSTQGEGLIMSANISEESPPEEQRPPGWSIARALAQRIGPAIAKRIREGFLFAKPSTKLFTLGITGLNSLKQYQMVKSFLREEIPQVKIVKEKTVGPGRALMVVEAVGGQAPAILETLANARVNGYTFRVKEVSPNVLEVELVPGPYRVD